MTDQNIPVCTSCPNPAEEWQTKCVACSDEYILLVRGKHENPTGGLRKMFPTVFPRACEVSIAPGWIPMIARVMLTLEREGEHGWARSGPRAIDGLTALQVKEKFGGLRFYHRLSDDAIKPEQTHAMIHTLEVLSLGVCEVCGSIGNVRGGVWVRTLCDEHSKIQDQERAARGIE